MRVEPGDGFALDALPEPMLPRSSRVLEMLADWRESGHFQLD